MIPAIPASTSAGSGVPTPPTRRRPIPRPGCTRRQEGRKPNAVTWARCSWRIGTAWWSIPASPRRPARPSERRRWRWRRQIPGQQRVTLGADKNDDTRDFVRKLRVIQVTPHVAQHTTGRSSAIDGRTTRHPGYAISQRKRKCVEEIFGWLKTVGLLRKTRHRGMARVGCGMSTRGARHAQHSPHRASLAQIGSSTPQGMPTIRPFPRLNFCSHDPSAFERCFAAAC